MKFIFNDNKLERLYSSEDGPYRRKYTETIINKFFDVVGLLAAIPDERSLYKFKGLHYEKLKGQRQGVNSIRLNDQWRLTMKLVKENDDSYFIILNIEDYH